MKKIINVIMISFFAVLSVNNKIGVSLILPIFLIMILISTKDLVMIVPLALISTWFFNINNIIAIIMLIIFIFLFILFFKSKNKIIINSILVFLFNMIVLVFINKEITINKIFSYTLVSVISVSIFIVLYLLVVKNYGWYYYFEVFSILVVILSAAMIKFDIMVVLGISMYYVMFFAISVDKLISFSFSLVVSVILYILYKDVMFFILPFVNSIYLIGNILSSFILVIVLAVISLFLPQNFPYALFSSIICIVFELIRSRLYNRKKANEKDIEIIKENMNKNFNNNIIAFSSFLEYCSSDLDSLNEKENKIKEGIENIITSYCNRCYLKDKCNENQEFKKSELKSLITNCNKKDYHIYDNRLLSKCPYNIEIRKSALIINSKIDFDNFKEKNKFLKKTFFNISNILKQYVVDNNLKEEIEIKEFSNLKNNIINSGYNLCYFNIINGNVNNFEIEIGIRGIDYKEIEEKIYNIIKGSFKYAFSLEYSHSDNDKTYFKIYDKKNIFIEVSSSNIASGSVSGDNIYIKERGNKLIAAICDGMGKGNKANKESGGILSLFNRLNEASLSTMTSLQILNSYCHMKEEYESYSTIDFLEINMKKNSAAFYKMSAAPSYIYRNNKKIEKIENELLPIGIEEQIEENEVILNENDVIVMSSDGFFENIQNENEVNEFILNICHLPVDKIVVQLVNYLKKNTKITDDDVSIIVLKVLGN